MVVPDRWNSRLPPSALLSAEAMTPVRERSVSVDAVGGGVALAEGKLTEPLAGEINVDKALREGIVASRRGVLIDRHVVAGIRFELHLQFGAGGPFFVERGAANKAQPGRRFIIVRLEPAPLVAGIRIHEHAVDMA